VSELVADMILVVSPDPQLGQIKGAVPDVTRTSPVCPQVRHWISKSGISRSPFSRSFFVV
jgi:hypothetical protein